MQKKKKTETSTSKRKQEGLYQASNGSRGKKI